jgi:hypothetical protein
VGKARHLGYSGHLDHPASGRKIMHRIALAALFLATPAAAQTVTDCSSHASAANLVEPWEANTRTFSNGKVRVALLDTVEPAATPFYLLVISPPLDELGLPQCRVIALRPNEGFYSLDFDRLDASYDPARGLTFTLPAGVYDLDKGAPVDGTLTFTLNQSTGDIATGFN